MAFLNNNDQDGFNSYISQDEFFNQMGMGGGSISTGPATGPATPTPNLNVTNGLSAGLSSVNAQILPTIGSPAIPYSAGTPAQPFVPAIPYSAGTPAQAFVPAIPSTPAYNPNESNNLSTGTTNAGSNPNGDCPCNYDMNCWSQTNPSNLTTYSGLSSPTCPSNTQITEPNNNVAATIGSPAIPYSAGTPAQSFVPAIPYSAGTPATIGSPAIPYSAGTPAQSFVPAIPYSAGTPAQAFVPAIPSTSGAPATYNMNCWSQTCPSTLSTYSGLSSQACPSNTQIAEPCLSPTTSSAFSGSGFNGESMWF